MTACFLSHCFAFYIWIFAVWLMMMICDMPPIDYYIPYMLHLACLYAVCCFVMRECVWLRCGSQSEHHSEVVPRWRYISDCFVCWLLSLCCEWNCDCLSFSFVPLSPHFMLSVLECYLWSPRRIKNDWGFGGFFNCYIARLFHLLLAQRVFLLFLQCELFLSAFVLWYGTRIGAALLWLYLVICFVIYVLLFVWWIGPIMPGSRLLTLCFGLFALSLNNRFLV